MCHRDDELKVGFTAQRTAKASLLSRVLLWRRVRVLTSVLTLVLRPGRYNFTEYHPCYKVDPERLTEQGSRHREPEGALPRPSRTYDVATQAAFCQVFEPDRSQTQGVRDHITLLSFILLLYTHPFSPLRGCTFQGVDERFSCFVR